MCLSSLECTNLASINHQQDSLDHTPQQLQDP